MGGGGGGEDANGKRRAKVTKTSDGEKGNLKGGRELEDDAIAVSTASQSPNTLTPRNLEFERTQHSSPLLLTSVIANLEFKRNVRQMTKSTIMSFFTTRGTVIAGFYLDFDGVTYLFSTQDCALFWVRVSSRDRKRICDFG